MQPFQKTIEIRWADLDPNFHVLHSRYYDFGAYCRMAFLVENGLTPQMMQAENIGPVIFREEAIFKRELAFGDEVVVNMRLSKATGDFSRWSMQHEIWKNGTTLAALVNLDGAWIDTQKRKLAQAPPIVTALFTSAPRSDDFSITETKEK